MNAKCPATRASGTRSARAVRPGNPDRASDLPADEAAGGDFRPRWEHFSHQADIGVRGFGRSPAEAFEQAALALTGVVTDPARVRPTERVEIACQAPDPELLLADWLNAVIFEMASRRMLFGRFEVSMTRDALDARIDGEPVDRRRHRPAVEIKGATYTALKVARLPDGEGWCAQAVLDV